MKIPCEVIQDLLPLYTEDMVSSVTRSLTEQHLAECPRCRSAFDAMCSRMPDVQFRLDTAQAFIRYEKRRKRRDVWRAGWKIAGITVLVCIAVFVIHAALLGGVTALWFMSGRQETDTDPSHYAQYMGETAKKKYRDKWGMDESVFPAAITPEMQVQNYKMVYYNPWDAQFLSYLTVSYPPDAYEAELQRLEACGVSDYLGYYGVTGFADEADPIAMYADDYYGFVYAMHTPGAENSITYVELIFCNYFFDLDYQTMIPAEYLPLGFDATVNNPYGREALKQITAN